MHMKILQVLFFFVSYTVLAQQTALSYYLPKEVAYAAEIPTPKSIIDHEVGAWHVTHDKLVLYMRALAKSSDRISIENRGTTFEGRPLLLLTITSPENHQRLEEIRQEHLAATDNPNNDVANLPVVVYQGFSIHGNEPSGSNAALLAAYHLAAATGDAIESLLDNAVILLDPSLNPDGLQRFAYWANTNKAAVINPDPNDREYHEVWPGGRTNHYWFDMNRDWLPVQLPESQARIETFHRWLPNILTDHHEMGTHASFFFQPGIPSRTNPLTPEINQTLTKQIAGYHVKAFDKLGSLYYSEESFDDFYYGKGSTFPDINGGVGILFEQGSSRGHAQESTNGVLTFPFGIRNQFTAVLSTLEAAKNMRVSLLAYQQNFYKNAKKEASKKKYIVFGDAKDAAKATHFAQLLERQNITLYALDSDMSSKGKLYKKGHSYVVPMQQKNSRLLKAMFQKRTIFQDSLFYDVSAWTLPLAFNLDYEENKAIAKLGKEVTAVMFQEGKVTEKSTYGYLIPWNEYYSPKALDALLEKNIRVKVGMLPFENNQKKYDYGTLFVPVQNQVLKSDALYHLLQVVARESHLKIIATTTGLNEGTDLGSNQFKTVQKQKIGLLVGEGVTSYDAGEIWHLLDQRYGMRVTKLDKKYLNRVDLSKYTTIIVPSSRKADATTIKQLKKWVKNGGTLIGYRYAVKWLASEKLIDLTFVELKKDTVAGISFKDKRKLSGAQVIGGAIFNADLDLSHPINFGYKNNQLPMFRNTTVFVNPSKKSYQNPIQYAKKPLLSGYISKENLHSLQGSVPFQVQQLGKGKVLVFTDNTNFRAFWYGTNKLLMNAIFFADKM